jgi:hypothetical protein
MSVNNSLVCAGLIWQWTKNKYLVLAKGEVMVLFCQLKAGSDATSKKTTAIDKGDHY